MEKLDDTINLSELNPTEILPEHNSIDYSSCNIYLYTKIVRSGQTEERAYSPNPMNINTEVQRNLSQLSISQIDIEPNFVPNTEISQGHYK